jgi:hypothetical protein
MQSKTRTHRSSSTTKIFATSSPTHVAAHIHLDRRKKVRTILRIGQRMPNKPEKIDRRFFGRAVEVYFKALEPIRSCDGRILRT